MVIVLKYPDPRIMMRKRINRNPALSLSVFKKIKEEDVFGFGVKLEELNNRLLSIALTNTLRKAKP